jgi:hypothetical protein
MVLCSQLCGNVLSTSRKALLEFVPGRRRSFSDLWQVLGVEIIQVVLEFVKFLI